MNVYEELRSYLPRYYDEIVEMQTILQVEGQVLGEVETDILSSLDQVFVGTATEQGLERWEKDLEIPIVPTKPIEQRRALILSKLRGMGTVSVEMIKNVAQSYSNGEVSIQEDHPNYTIVVTFIGERGVPENLLDIQHAIREVIPAHLAVNFVFTYLSWSEWDALGLTWDQSDALNLTWDELEIYKP